MRVGDVRRVIRTEENELRFGASFKQSWNFHPMIKRLIHRSAFDPAHFYRNKRDQESMCVIISILMTMYSRLGRGWKTVTKDQFWSDMNGIKFTEIDRQGKKGFSFTQLDAIEKQNSPLSPQLIKIFGSLVYFSGLSLNVFKILKEGNKFRLFPVSLSKNHRNSNFFQIDLIQITNSMLNKPQQTESVTQHCLVVPRLSRMLTKFTDKRINWVRCDFVCRSCAAIFTCKSKCERHYLVCQPDSRKAVLSRKRSRNVFIHRPMKFNNFSQRYEINGLKWLRSNSYKLLRPLAAIFIDFESYHVPFDRGGQSIHMNIPTGSLHEQVPMSYSYIVRNLYKDIPMPECLSEPRVKVCQQNEDSNTDSLLVSLFLSLRKDLVRLHEFLGTVLSYDSPPLPSSRRDPRISSYIQSQKYCQFCGTR